MARFIVKYRKDWKMDIGVLEYVTTIFAKDLPEVHSVFRSNYGRYGYEIWSIEQKGS